MTPFDMLDTAESIRHVNVALTRYRELTAVQFVSFAKTLTDTEEVLARSRTLLTKVREKRW